MMPAFAPGMRRDHPAAEIDAELAQHLHRLPSVDLSDVVTARKTHESMFTGLPAPRTDDVTVNELCIPGTKGDPPVPVRVYVPHRRSGPAAIVDVHGGGFVLGSVTDNHAANIAIARSVGVVVVSVEYRRAPENRFPAALHDCAAALRWLADHAGHHGIEATSIALHGISAGAGLCAALSLVTRDTGGPHICFQYLGSPVLDDRLTTPSMTTMTSTPVWNRDSAELSWDAYLGSGRRAGPGVSPYAAPARAADLRGLPPTYISVQAFDPLRDEGTEFALALLRAEVPVELHLLPGTFHGSTIVHSAQVSKRETRERVAVLRRGLGLPPS